MFAFLACLMLMLAERDKPTLYDLKRFPPAEVAELNYSQASCAAISLRLRYELSPPDTAEQAHWGRAAEEALILAETWRWLDFAYRYGKHYLSELRILLTPAEWHTGHMPPTYPYWRYEEVK